MIPNNRPRTKVVVAWLLPLIAILILTSCKGDQPASEPSSAADSQSVSPATATSESMIEEDENEISTSVGRMNSDGFDAFIDQSYRHLLLRDPERVTNLGLQRMFGIADDELTNISLQFTVETSVLQRSILDELHTFNRDGLDEEQKLTYDIFEWYLEDLVRGAAFPYHDYPATHFLSAEHNQIAHFFTEIHPIANESDAKNYITRLEKLPEKFQQLKEGLRIRQEMGIVPPRYIVERAAGQIGAIAYGDVLSTPFYQAFAQKIAALDSLTDTERQALLNTAESVIEDSVIPAYMSLLNTLSDMELAAPVEIGVGSLPDGKNYYTQLLRHYTTTELTAEEIHELGLGELERIHGEMRSLFSELGYPENETIPQLYSLLGRSSRVVSRDDVVPTYEEIIAGAAASLDGISSLRPEAEVVVKGVPSGGFYVAPSIDGSRPGAFYATNSRPLSWFAMPTLAYHEAIPGHHFQLAVAQELGLPLFRNTVKFGAYVEGWALYAERLAWENGLYADDPSGDLGRLQAEAFRASRLVVDTGIHSRGWTRDQAIQFMVENAGLSRNMVANQVDRYVALPGQATGYSIGMLKILELRDRAQEELGERFDLIEFNDLVLSQGSIPLPMLEGVFDQYISEQLDGR